MTDGRTAPSFYRPYTRPPWIEHAACRGMDPGVFYVHQGENATEARAICRGCPVREPCVEYAIATHEEHGIWGDTTPGERDRIVRNRRRRGAA